jgi:hypothetical protein
MSRATPLLPLTPSWCGQGGLLFAIYPPPFSATESLGLLRHLTCYLSRLFLDRFITDTPWLTQHLRYVRAGASRILCESEFCVGYTWSIKGYMYIQGSPAHIRTPTHWKLIGSSMTAPPPVLPLSTILPQPSSHCAFITARKNSACVPKILFQLFPYFKIA